MVNETGDGIEHAPEGGGVSRARTRLLGIRERAATERLRTAATFSILSTTGPMLPQQQAGRLRLGHLSQRPTAETLDAQCEAFAEAMEIAHQAGIIKAPTVLAPIGTANGRIANVIPMVHPVTTAQGEGQHADLIVSCQEECYRLTMLLARLGVRVPLHVEGETRQNPLKDKVIDCGNGNVPFTDPSVAVFLAEHPQALTSILSRYRFTNGQGLSFANLLHEPPLALETDRVREASAKFYRDDAALYAKMWRNELNVSELAAWMAAVQRFQAMKEMMDQDFAAALSAPGTPALQRAAIGAAHRDETARLLREGGTEVWITEPAHVPDEFLSSQLESPQYLWAKNYMAQQDKK